MIDLGTVGAIVGIVILAAVVIQGFRMTSNKSKDGSNKTEGKE